MDSFELLSTPANEPSTRAGAVTERQALLILNALPGMGPITLNRLLAAFGGDPCAVLAAARERLEAVRGVGPIVSAAITDWPRHFDLAREEARIAAGGIELVTCRDPHYPSALRQIPDPPIALYVRGRLPDDTLPCVALIGTRQPSHYGLETARHLAREFARLGICVVSGLARGIDGAAHRGAIEGGGRTVGVIGSGMDIVFPPEHGELYRNVAEQGAVVSEFPFGRPPDKQTFPIRNRVVAGLCRAVIVVESRGSGGAMITANFAGDYGRLVFAVPGRIDQPGSQGPHILLREGAILCRSVEDVLCELNPYVGQNAPGTDSQGLLPGLSGTAQTMHPPGSPEALLSTALAGRAGCTADELADLTAQPVATVLEALLGLELDGSVSRRLDGRYELLRSRKN